MVLSMVAAYYVGRVALDAAEKMSRDLSVLNQIPELESLLKDAETGQRGFLITGEQAYLQPYNNALEGLDKRLTQLQTLARHGDVSPAEVEEIAGLTHQKVGEMARTVALRREKGFDAALQEVRTDVGKNLMDQIRRHAAGIKATAQDDYNQAVRKSNHADWTRTIVFVTAGVLDLAFLAWAFQRITRDEWLRTAEVRLSAAVAGGQTLAQLGDNILGFLAEYLGANAGALFVDETGFFHRKATYAIADDKDVPERVASGQGLVGQAAKDAKPVLVSHVPDGYLAVSSSLGRARARRLLIAPVKVDGAVNAVIELGFFRSPRGPELKFFERIQGMLGVAVRTAQYRTRLQELLSETQRQAEELQAQSEELRVSNEELEEQSRALKESQSRLENQQAELEGSNSQLEEQTRILETQKEDLERVKEDLEKQAEVIEQASRYKSDFLANMSHELRTPLNSSLMLAKLLADNREKNLTPEQIKYAQTIYAAGNDLLNLINDILDLAKVEAGRMELKLERVPVSHLTEALRNLFAPMAANKTLVLKIQPQPGAPEYLETDRHRLEQVLKNLLSNAIKFTERGEVALEISGAPGHKVAFAVRDTGIGISPDQQSLVFDPFCQGDSGTSRKYGGTGLGLSISRELVHLMGGDIHLASDVGRGSVFTVTLPEKFVGRVESKREVSVPVRREEAPMPGKQDRRETHQGPSIPPKARIIDDREKLKGGVRVLLIVEDDAAFATILLDIAHEMKFQGLIADSAEEALALAMQFSPSAIILDIGLPDNSGMLVLERLKADSRTRHIPVHVVSGSDYTQTAMALGAVGYMLKPVRREQLIETFEKLETRLSEKLRRVLVVEDDPVQLESLSRLLGSHDVETIGVRTAAECLEKLKSTTFDCMVLDLSLPDASGFSILDTLSAEQTYSFPPVIIYTGRELSVNEEQRLRRHSKSIIIKGAKSPERLLDEVTLFLHQVVADLPPEKQQMLETAKSREASLLGKCILIAEDDVRNIFALTSLLEPRGIKIQIARNGREALEALQKSSTTQGSQIDLVLMDIMMPEVNGFTAIREIRKNPDWKRLPIVAMTAKAMKNDQEQCLEAGANDYLAKPLDVEKLLSLIRVWMPR
jgi:signal transduction histidine kinase/CheY-like chemotaxis protein/CHASE3 domain sensor protein